MKKTLVFLLFFLLSMGSFSQEVLKLKTDKNCIGTWNILSEKYEFGEINYSLITFSFYNDYISSDDASMSIYRVKEQLPKNFGKNSETISAKCLDERNRDCTFALMKMNDGSLSIGVLYNDIIYVYFVEKN